MLLKRVHALEAELARTLPDDRRLAPLARIAASLSPADIEECRLYAEFLLAKRAGRHG